MSQVAKNYFTPEEYLRLEENSTDKHEYFQGEIFLMARGSETHNLISANVITELNLGLRAKLCRTYSSDMRIQVQSNGLFTYADVSVVYGKVEFASDRTDTITNPTLIVEVLSPSTEKYDRSQKFELYRNIDIFAHYLVIDQSRVYVEYHHKIDKNKWEMETFNDLTQNIQFVSLNLKIALTNLYAKVEFPT